MRFLLPAALFIACFLISCKKNKKEETPIPNNQALTWAKDFGGTEYDFINAVVQLSDGSYVTAGATRSSGTELPGTRWGYDVWLAKVDASGNKVWYTTSGDNDDNYATGIVATSDGGFLVSGYTFVNNMNYAWVMKANSSGVQEWIKQMSASTDAKAAAIISAGDGNYIVTGYVSGSGSRDGWVAKIDLSGNILWSKTFGGANEDQFTSVIKSTDGSFALAGYSSSSNGDLSANKGSYDGWVVKIDASGNKTWSASYGGSGEDYLKGITNASDGGYVVAGYTKSTNGDIPLNKGGNEEWIVKLSASGTKDWVKTYGGLNEEYVFSIIPSREGGYITVGYTNSTTGDVVRNANDFGAWLVKTDASGNKVAASTYGSAPNDDQVTAIIPTQDGGFLMAGNQWVDGRQYDGWLVKIDNF